MGSGVCFCLWAGSGGNICMSAWEWLRPGRGGAHECSGKAEGTGWALSDFAALAGVGDFLNPGSQEASEAGPSHLASVLGRVPALPAWPRRCRGALRVRILSLLHHKLALCFSPPNPRLQTPHHRAGLAWLGQEEERLRGRGWGLSHLSPVPGHPV